MKFEIKNTIPFPLVSRKVKYLVINLTKFIHGLYEENYKTQLQETKELNKQKDIVCLWTGRLNNVQRSVLPNVIYRFNAIPIKIPKIYLCVWIN